MDIVSEFHRLVRAMLDGEVPVVGGFKLFTDADGRSHAVNEKTGKWESFTLCSDAVLFAVKHSL